MCASLDSREFNISHARQIQMRSVRGAIIAVVAAAIVAGSGFLSYRLAFAADVARMDRDTDNRLTLIASTFDTTVARFRYLPTVLSLADPIRDLYRNPHDSRSIDAANRYLKSLNQAAGSAELFVLDSAGLALAASNFDEDTTFVGHTYDFRNYFQDAIRAGEGQYYAVGATTGLPGYFLSHRVTEGGQTIGVAVVKIDLRPLEADWVRAGDLVAMADGSGVVFLASRERWKYHPLSAMPPASIAQLNATRQYASAIESTPVFRSSQNKDGILIGRTSEVGRSTSSEYALHSRLLPAHGWRLLIFSDLDEVRRRAATMAAAIALAALALLLIGLVAYQRQQAVREKMETHDMLERSVAERTAELSAANARLSTEVEERVRAEEELRRTHDTLVQSAKLASLGQALAGVAHEINQPLAALTTYVASSRVLLRRNEIDRIAANLDLMLSITERMMALIGHLRMFARRETGARSPVDLVATIGNAMRLVDYRIRNEGVEVAMTAPSEPTYALANPVRLEQVFVNLLSNAIDAMRDRERRVLGIAVRREGGMTVTDVSDTGSGIAPEHLKSLFDPFFTTKEIGEGLGLGLSISYGIIKEFGGAISVESALGTGSRFQVILPAKDMAPREQQSELQV
jgi:two-component system, NtrC family, C4-dicarboxylate transport sensor histidine kinase DctB